MKLKDICSYLDSEIPLSFQESYDNSGLQVGNPEREVTSATLALDVTGDVLKEAITVGSNLIISHHPLIFHGLKSLTGKNSVERILLEAIKNDIAIYSAHTNLDALSTGVSRKMAEKLKIYDVKVLAPLKERLLKLVTFIPESHFNNVRDAIFEAGAGVIGNYDRCGFSAAGYGSFRGNENTTPFVGEKGKVHSENEIRFETILFSYNRGKVIKALTSSHPYEEVAYDLYALENDNLNIGMGCVGHLAEPVDENNFLKLVSSVFEAKGVRHSKVLDKKIYKVAVCGGSGSSLIPDAIASGADAYITADLKYHNFFDAENAILLVDTGHFESEKFSVEILNDLIIKKFPKFAVRFSETNTNPINYL
jgi:dinuclear metal center YbgI/SA1388 family protein